ncbi:unnamed protein product [Acanthosepion pharaonis]|uniref:Uncharacterized protein n=1 Tax=Acanthosepion pharaonis TaxID=158019 RepID=A0A812BDZ5_ACAPH|nr:unnamed protein product [Sepia pharaonis]
MFLKKDISLYLSREKQNFLVLSLGRMFLQDISLASPEKNRICLVLSLGRMFLQDISLVSKKTESYYLSEELQYISSPEKTELSRIISRKNVLARYLISLSELSREIISRKNCLVLSLGRMFLQDISLVSPEKTELSRIISRKNVLARYLISLSRENRIVCIISRKNVLARYLSLGKRIFSYYLSEECLQDISLVSPEKTELSRIISRKNVLARYLISLSRKQNCLVLSLGRMFLQDISLASPEKNRIVSYYLSEECSCKISH